MDEKHIIDKLGLCHSDLPLSQRRGQSLDFLKYSVIEASVHTLLIDFSITVIMSLWGNS